MDHIRAHLNGQHPAGLPDLLLAAVRAADRQSRHPDWAPATRERWGGLALRLLELLAEVKRLEHDLEVMPE